MAQYNSTQISELSTRILERLEKNRRFIVTIAGTPGSGKSKISGELCELLNHSVSTKILPQDGYHYYRLELAQFEDPDLAFERRGAPFTYDSERFLNTIKTLQNTENSIFIPSFDHRLKDPIENDIEITPDTKIIIIEGNYVSLKDPIWDEISDYADETWFVQVDPKVVLNRIVDRHLAAGISSTREEAIARAQGSDKLNSDYILQNSKAPDLIIVNN